MRITNFKCRDLRHSAGSFFRRAAAGRGLRGCLRLQVLRVRLRIDGLAGDAQLDLVTDLRHVLAETEGRTLERGRGIEADRRKTGSRVRADLDDCDVQSNRLGYTMQAKIAGDFELIGRRAFLNVRASEGRAREFGRVEEIRRPKMFVETRYTRAQALERYRHRDGRPRRIGAIEFERALTLSKLCGGARESEVVPSKHALGVVRLERIGGGMEGHGCQSKPGSEGGAANHWANSCGWGKLASNLATRDYGSPESLLKSPE